VSKPTDLVQGTLDLLILKIVALEPTHGWAIAQRIRQISGEVLQVGQSALYPALHKLEQQGWIKAEWKISETTVRLRLWLQQVPSSRPPSRSPSRAACESRAPMSSQQPGAVKGAPVFGAAKRTLDGEDCCGS